MRRYRNLFMIIRIIAIVVFGLMVAGFLALTRIDPESLRGDLTAGLRNATGLPASIDGAISWKFSLRPLVSLEKVRIPNAEWAKEKNGFYAGRIEAQLDIISMLRGHATIESVKIYNAEINIEQNDKKEYSLQIEGQSLDSGIKTYPFDLDMGLESVELYDVSLNINGTHNGLSSMRIKYEDTRDAREISGWLQSKKRIYPFIAQFSKYNEERKVYPVRIALSMGGDALVANIALEGTSKIPVDFNLSGNVENASDFMQIFGIDLPDLPKARVNIAGGFGHNKMTVRKSSISFRGSDMEISGGADWSGALPSFVLRLNSKKINLMTSFPEMYAPEIWARPNRELNVFHDVSLRGHEFRKFDLDLSADIGQLIVYRDLTVMNIGAKAVLKNSKARADVRAKIGGGGIQAAIDAEVDAYGKISASAAGIGERVWAGEIMDQLREPNYVSDLPMNFEFYLRAAGANLSQLMSSVTGPVFAYSVGAGYAHSELVTYFFGSDFLTDLRHGVTDLFRSKKKYDQISIGCAAINVKARNGVIETQRGIAVESNAINLRATGQVDLGAERIKASLVSVPVRGIKLSITGNVINNTEFSGNLAEPDIKINGTAVVAKATSAAGLGLLLAPFTGGVGLIAGAGIGYLAGDLLDNWLSDDHPCRTAMQNGAPAKDRDPEWMNKPMNELVSEMIQK